ATVGRAASIAGASNPLRRSSSGKSLAAPACAKATSGKPEKFWLNATGERSITDPCAGDSARIGWDRPCAFFSRDPLCPAAKHPANVALRHRLVLVPMEPVPPVFECGQA